MAKSDAIWKWVLFALVITGVMTWLVLQPASTKKAASGDPRPRIFLDRDTHDFGAVMSGEKVTHRFKIRNVGDAPLVLRKISASCSCTVPKVERTHLPPDATSTIEAELTVRAGRRSSRIYIDSNDPDQPRAIIQITSEGIKTVRVEPSGFDFGEMRLGQTASSTVRLTAGDGEPFTILTTKLPELKGIEVTIVARPLEPDADGRSARWNLALTATPRDHLQSKFFFTLGVLTDHPAIREHKVEGYCALRHPLQWIDEPRHFLGVARPGKSVQTELILASDNNAIFKILETRPLHDDAFKIIKIEPLDEGRRHRLTLRAEVPSGAPQGFRATRLRIRTDLPVANTLEPSFSIHVLAR